MNSNPNLKEVCTDTWEGGVKVSKKDKATMKKKGIEHHEEDSIPDSDIDSEESEVDDEEHSDENSDSSEDGSEDSDDSEESSESSGEESSEDEIEVEMKENGVGKDGIEGSVTGGDISRERNSMWWRIAFFLFTLLALLFANYFENLS